MPQTRAAGVTGFTLVELLTVVAILAIILVVAQPGFSTNDANKVALAASEVANALRFARSEASRTGDYHGFRMDAGTDRLRIFVLTDPFGTPTESFTVYHPLDKNLYDIDLGASRLSKGITATADFDYGGSLETASVAFSPSGAPVSPQDLTPLSDAQGEVVVGLGNNTRKVLLCTDTGRVIVQQGSETCL